MYKQNENQQLSLGSSVGCFPNTDALESGFCINFWPVEGEQAGQESSFLVHW